MARKSTVFKNGSLPKIQIQNSRSKRHLNLVSAMAKKKILIDDVTHSGVLLFNQLPQNVKSDLKSPIFKQHVKKYLLERNESLIKPGQFTSRNLRL